MKAKEIYEKITNIMNVGDVTELYKALIARELNIKEYNEELDKVLDKSLDVNYFANDNMHFIDVDLCWAIRDDVEAARIETLD